MDLDYHAIGKRIKKARHQAGLTQEQLADRADLSLSHICNVERAINKIGLSALVSIANALGVTANDLLMDSSANDRPSFERQLQEIVDDCTLNELQVLVDVSRTTLEAMRKYAKKQGH